MDIEKIIDIILAYTYVGLITICTIILSPIILIGFIAIFISNKIGEKNNGRY